MGITANDVVPFTQARASLSELADQAKAGAEKIITKNGESYVALIDADRLDYYHRLERERIHLLLQRIPGSLLVVALRAQRPHLPIEFRHRLTVLQRLLQGAVQHPQRQCRRQKKKE